MEKGSLLVISSHDDLSTDEVLNWVSYFNIFFSRINGEDSASIKKLTISECAQEVILSYSKGDLKISESNQFWYRRGEIKFNYDIKNSIFSAYLQQELEKVTNFIDYLFTNGNSINKPSDNNINKLILLQAARKVGLKIPMSQIDCQISDTKNKITKAISELGGIILVNSKKVYFGKGTQIVNNLDKGAKFFPSFFQKYIEKQIEIRTFYLGGKFYSMAMFTQQNSQTSIDFRRYDRSKMNRRVPYKLPNGIEIRLRKLMKKLNLNTGSMDLIKNLNGDYYFLEVNPVGQFGMVSNPCNYYLYKKIADYLK
jgi:ATP-GRASP peptide maturase of grasp-with-spasm system